VIVAYSFEIMPDCVLELCSNDNLAASRDDEEITVASPKLHLDIGYEIDRADISEDNRGGGSDSIDASDRRPEGEHDRWFPLFVRHHDLIDRRVRQPERSVSSGTADGFRDEFNRLFVETNVTDVASAFSISY
jgi:hypothetical protein